MGKTKSLKYWNIPVPRQLDDKLTSCIKSGEYVSKAEFVRSSVREKLRREGWKS